MSSWFFADQYYPYEEAIIFSILPLSVWSMPNVMGQHKREWKYIFLLDVLEMACRGECLLPCSAQKRMRLESQVSSHARNSSNVSECFCPMVFGLGKSRSRISMRSSEAPCQAAARMGCRQFQKGSLSGEILLCRPRVFSTRARSHDCSC